MVPHLFPLKLCPGSPGHCRSSRPKKISMERERRDEFGRVKRPPLRNRLKAFFICHPRPFFLFTSRGWWRAWAVGSTLVKPKIEEFRHGSDLTLKIIKRFKTSFTGTSHRKSFYIFVSKDKEKKEMGEGQNSKLGPWATYDFWSHACKQNVGWTHRPPLALAQKGNFEIHLCPLLPSPKHCLLSVNLLWIGLAHLWNLC